MIIFLDVNQLKEAVCVYINSAKLIDLSVWEVLPENVTIQQHTDGDYDSTTNIFDGLNIRPTLRKK